MATGPPEDWVNTYKTLKDLHDQAYVKLDEAIKLEEQEQKDTALSKYEEGLRLMDLALELQIECPANADYSWEKACSMIQKLKTTRKEVLSRIAAVQVTKPEDADPYLAPPPTYEEAMSAPPSLSPTTAGPPLHSMNSLSNAINPSTSRAVPNSGPMTYSQLGEALSNLKFQTNTQSAQVIYTYENVRIYFVHPNGCVSAPSDPSTLRVLQLEDGADEAVKYYLQVGEWFYPLVPNVSPCLRTSYGAYILPDVNSGEEGAAVGLVFPPESDESVFELLEDLLHNVVVIEPKSPPRSPRTRREDSSTSAKLSRGLVSGAQAISCGLIKGAEKASQLLNSSTPKVMEKITPETIPRQVSPKVVKGVEVARNVSGTAVTVTGYVAGKIGGATMALGRYLAPHIQKHGTRLLSTARGVDEQTASQQVGGMLEVAAGAVEGFSTVYNGLEQSAGILGNSLANNTVQLVQHKYGQPMGEVTGHTLSTVGNVIVAGNNVKFLTPKGLAKKTIKGAGKGMVYDLQQGIRNDLQQQQQKPYPEEQSLSLNGINGSIDFDKFKPPDNQLDKPGPSKQ